MKKICIHGGHAVIGSRGAKGYLDEVDIDRLLTRKIVSYLHKKGYNVKNINVRSGTQNQVLVRLRDKADKEKATSNISIHLNAGGGNGFEVWLHPNAKNKAQWEKACKQICNTTTFKNRGVKESSGLYVLNHLKNCALLEVGFVDSRTDKKIYDKLGVDFIAKAIANALITFIL